MSEYSEESRFLGSEHSEGVPRHEPKIQLWKINDAKAMKNGSHSTIYWVKQQKKFEDGSYIGEKWRTSTKYTGAWKDDKKFGFGIQQFENGDKYEGGWENNKRNGQGTLWIKDEKHNLRRRYTGDWYNDKKEGRGTMFFQNEDRYDGFWKENQPSGEGRMIYKNGDVYVGQWHEGKRCGYGVFTRRNGDHFEGNWVNNLREGQGSYFFAEKNKVFVGEWVEDRPSCGIYSEVDDPNIQTNKQKGLPRDFDEIPVLPELALIDPSEVLQSALNRAREKRLFFRARYMSLHILYTTNELNELIKEFSNIARGSNIIECGDVCNILIRMGFNVDEQIVEGYMRDIYVEDDTVREKLDAIDFEVFARIVAIVLEDANKINEVNVEEDQIEGSFMYEGDELVEEQMIMK